MNGLRGQCTVFFLLALALAASAEDRVIFVDDFVMEATVISYDSGSDVVTLKVRYGTLAIPGKRVRSVDYDTTISRAIPDDNDQALALAGLMERHGGFESAIQILEALRSRKDPPADIELRLGKLYEKSGNYSKAIEMLRAYLDRHPDDLSVQAEIDRLMKELKGKEPVREEPVIDVVKEKVEEGFEDGGWRVEPWGNAGEIFYVSLGSGDRLLKIELLKGPKDKLAARKNLVAEQSDLTKTPILTFDAYNNTTGPLNIGVAVVTSPGWKYFESKQISLPPRQWKQALTLDLSGKDFKSEDTNWNYTSEIQNLKSTIQILLLIYHGDRTGTVFFNNMAFGKRP